ncbi:MAG: ABC transporter ATP-binding protein [Actinobacteria bacterium]|nr:ABC transporter ATP-binding protein [Actinomycetota bacterium]
MAVIECRNLVKRYGNLTAVNSLSFSLEPGELVGFVGPNGAGKTSTLKILVGLSHADSGEAFLAGNQVTPFDNKASATVGYMPDDPAFASWMTPLEHLRFLGRFFYKEKETVGSKAEELIGLFGLEHLKKRKIGGFSKGERQRLALAHALTGEPTVLIMDEPTSGLDPLGRRELLDYIKGLEGRMTILFSTHLLTDVDRVCERVVMLDKGRIIADDKIPALKDRYSNNSFLLDVEGNPEKLLDRLKSSEWCGKAVALEASIEFMSGNKETAFREIPAMVAELGLGIRRFEALEYSLEDVFTRILQDYEAGEVTL